MVGPLKKAPGGFEYIYVAIDKFTKWIEYQPLTTFSSVKAIKFMQSIFARFGMPNRIITDLGSPFTAEDFTIWAGDSGIAVDYASVAHPQANGQVERANGLLLAGLKPRLYDELKDFGGRWMEELPKVIWGLRTQQSRATGCSPFYLVYGAEAILPSDLIWRSARVEQYEEGEAADTRRLELDTLEEQRLAALVQSAQYLQGCRRHYDKNVRPRTFQVGDLVLRKIQNKTGRHKLRSPWEGPYIVSKVTRPGSFELMTQEGIPVRNSWNIEHLRKFHA